MNIALHSFNGGEVSPMVYGRTDLESLRRACIACKGFMLPPTGGAFRRPPLLYVSTVRAARLLPMNVGADQAFILELGDRYMKFWNADGTLAAAQVVAPWATAQLDEVQFSQVNDVIFFTHPDVEPHELLRKAGNIWELRPIPWKWPSMKDVNVSATTMTFARGVYTVDGRPWAASATVAPGPLEWNFLSASATIAIGYRCTHEGRRWEAASTIPMVYWFTHNGGGSPGPRYRPATMPGEGAAWTDLGLEILPWAVGSAYVVGSLIVASGAVFSATADHVGTNENAPAAAVLNSKLGQLTASADTFRAEHVGSQWAIGHYRATATSSLTPLPRVSAYPAAGDTEDVTIFPHKEGSLWVSRPIEVRGRWDFSTTGRWKGEVIIQRKNAAGLWDVVRRITGELDTNKNLAGDEDEPSLMRVAVSNLVAYPAGGTVENPEIPAPSFRLECIETETWGVVRVERFIDAKNVTVEETHGSVYSGDATALWAEGSWSRAQGFPRAVTLHEQRLVFGGTRGEPQKLWSSVIGDFRNFRDGTYDDSSWSFQIAAHEANPILWIASQAGGLIIGTRGDEWLMEGGERGITPSSVKAQRKSAYGSAPVQPLLAGSATLFIQRGRSSILEYVYSFEEANYLAPDLNQLTEHLTREGIRAIAHARNPWPTLWVVTTDGQLLSCTYSRAEQIIAWTRQPVGGLVSSVAVAYGRPGKADEVWISVTRDGVTTIERLDPEHWRRLHDDGHVYHLDAAVTQTPVNGVVSATHLANKAVSVYINGIDQGERMASPVGGVSVQHGGPVVVGLPSPDAELVPFFYALQLDDGTTEGRKWRVPQMTLRLYQSRLGRYSSGGGEYEIVTRQAGHSAELAPPLFSGLANVNVGGDFQNHMNLRLRSSGSQPLNVLALFPKAGVYGT